MASLKEIATETVHIIESTIPRGIRYNKSIGETEHVVESLKPVGARFIHIINETERILENVQFKGARKLWRAPERENIYERVYYVMKQLNWTDPTYYQLNDIPTTNGPERLNINSKVIDKLNTLFDYIHGDDVQDFTFKNNSGTDLTIQITDSSRGLRIINSTGTLVFRIDNNGQIVTGINDAGIISAQFPGVQLIQNKVNNFRIPAPYDFIATSIFITCDDSSPPTGSALSFRINNDNVSIGTVSISANSSNSSTNISVNILKNTIFTYDCIAAGSSFAGQDVHIQIRGYRTGTLL